MAAKKRIGKTKASKGKTRARSVLLGALSEITGLSANDIRTELKLLAKPAAKKPVRGTRRKK